MNIDLNYYNNLPETISTEEVEKEVRTIVSYEYSGEADYKMSLMEAWDVISDKQYHTYELPSEQTKGIVLDWVNKNWNTELTFISLVGSIIWCFGLREGIDLLKQSLKENIPEETRNEINAILNDIEAHTGDPYYDLR